MSYVGILKGKIQIYMIYTYIWKIFFKKTRRKFKILFKKLRKCIQYVQWSTIKLDFAFVDLVLLLLFKSLFLLYDSKKKGKTTENIKALHHKPK